MEAQQRPADHVDVHLTDCSPEVAEAVFGVLAGVYRAATEDIPGVVHQHPAGHPVWAADFDVSARSGAPERAALEGGATVDLFGCDGAVRHVRDTLLEFFGAEEKGVVVSGDGEVELRMRLAPS